MEHTQCTEHIHYFHRYLLSSYYVPGPVLDTGESAVNKTDRNLVELAFGVGGDRK